MLSLGCNPYRAQPTFILIASASGTTDDGKYGVIVGDGYGLGNGVLGFTDNEADATLFSFNDSCDLVDRKCQKPALFSLSISFRASMY